MVWGQGRLRIPLRTTCHLEFAIAISSSRETESSIRWAAAEICVVTALRGCTLV